MKNPQQSAKLWKQNLGSASAQEKAKASVQALTQSPTQQAAAQQQKMLQKITDAVNSGRYAAACQEVTLPQWQQAYVQKALPRFAAGAQGAESYMQQFFAHHNQVCEQLSQGARAMPKNNDQDALERVRYVMQGMKSAYGKS